VVGKKRCSGGDRRRKEACGIEVERRKKGQTPPAALIHDFLIKGHNKKGAVVGNGSLRDHSEKRKKRVGGISD